MGEIYHGTVNKNLDTIKPFKRFTPGDEEIADTIPPRIYATYNPAFAVAHSFPWSSEDGVDIKINGEEIVVEVPIDKQNVLQQEVCIYTLSDYFFTLTKEEETGLTYHSENELKPNGCHCFESVVEAMNYYGGKIKLLP